MPNAVKGKKGFQKAVIPQSKPITTDLQQIRNQKRQKMQAIIDKRRSNPSEFWNTMKSQTDDFVHTYLPSRKSDFAAPFLPSDDNLASSGTGTDTPLGFHEYKALAEQRIGIGPRITEMVANDAVREKFKFLNIKRNRLEEREDIREWAKNADFYNQLAWVIYFERVYGIGFLVKYYTDNDKEKETMEESPGKGRKPIAFQAFPPTIMAPTDDYKSDKLDKDPQKWNVRGGVHDPREIHYERVRVFMSRPVINRWYGLSVFERISEAILSYYQGQIYLKRAFSRLGNMLLHIALADEEGDLEDIYDEHVDLFEEMKMNGTIITKKGTEFNFIPTQIATGLRDIMEVWLEDIAAGVGIPVPVMMGRITSAGLGGAAYLMAERMYWNTVSKVQRSFTDDVEAILRHAGFDLKGLELYWNLAVTKTDQQRLLDEGMELQNQMLEEQIKQMKLQTVAMGDAAKNGTLFGNGQGKPGNGGVDRLKEGGVKDFTETINAIIESQRAIRSQQMWRIPKNE